MAAGHIVNGSCVDVAASADAFFSGLAPASTPGAVTYQTQASKETVGWYLHTYEDGVLLASSALTVPSFASCDTTDTFFDGMTLGWLVVVAMVAAYAVHALRRAF